MVGFTISQIEMDTSKLIQIRGWMYVYVYVYVYVYAYVNVYVYINICM